MNNREYFLTIAEEGSISKAAERLFVTQPSLSKYLRRLEEELGIQLFSRDSYPLQLTEAGKLYKDYIEDQRFREHQMRKQMAELRAGLMGHVTVCMTEWRSSVVLPALLPRFKEKFPYIELAIKEGSHHQMVNWLEHDQADIALINTPNQFQNLQMDVLVQEKVVYCLHKDIPALDRLSCRPVAGRLQHMDSEEFRLLKDVPFILAAKGQHIREIEMDFFNSLNIMPPILIELKSNLTKYNLVRDGMGGTFIGYATLGENWVDPNVCYFTLGDPPLHWNLAVGYPHKRPLSIYAQKVVQVIQEIIEENKQRSMST